MSMGMAAGGHQTANGTYYVQEKMPSVVMDSSTYGVPVNSIVAADYPPGARVRRFAFVGELSCLGCCGLVFGACFMLKYWLYRTDFSVLGAPTMLACASSQKHNDLAPIVPPVTLEVINNGWIDAIIYVYHSGQRYRLGFVNAHARANFHVPAPETYDAALPYHIPPMD